MVRQTDHQITAYRIGDPVGRYPVFSAEGSRLNEGRWNAKGDSILYTSEHYSTALLEKLVGYSGVVPPNQHVIEITIPAGVAYEIFNVAHVPDWASDTGASARAFGHQWYKDRRSAILFVPSVPGNPDRNVLIHENHADFPKIRAGLETPIKWDRRLFT